MMMNPMGSESESVKKKIKKTQTQMVFQPPFFTPAISLPNRQSLFQLAGRQDGEVLHPGEQ